jgi:alpha-tubulin suppressor-like RCC1 family protein
LGKRGVFALLALWSAVACSSGSSGMGGYSESGTDSGLGADSGPAADSGDGIDSGSSMDSGILSDASLDGRVEGSAQDGSSDAPLDVTTADAALDSGAGHDGGNVDAGIDGSVAGAEGGTQVGTDGAVPTATGYTQHQLAAGNGFTCARRPAGTAWCWGENNDQQLGDGTTTNRTSAVQVTGLAGAADIGSGTNSTCAVTTAADLLCWGVVPFDNQVPAPPSPPSDGAGGAAEVTNGNAHVCFSTPDGALACWGGNGNDENGSPAFPPPVDIVNLVMGPGSTIDVGANYETTCSVGPLGTVSCWGANNVGQLGDGKTHLMCASGDCSAMPVQVSGLSDAVSIGRGLGEHVCAVRSGGGVVCWGDNTYGELGDGTTTSQPTPVVALGVTNGVEVGDGDEFTCALLATGGVDCWGTNPYGQLGDGTTNYHLTPMPVAGLTDAIELAVGEDHACALRATGDIVCWGNNAYGQLGNGTTTASPIPVTVLGMPYAPGCPGTLQLCGAACYDLQTDVNHCGLCATKCPQVSNGAPTCVGAMCGLGCNGGYHACGDDCADNNAVSTCGSSCTPCPTSPLHGVETCNGTVCGFVCDPGYQPAVSSCAPATSVPYDLNGDGYPDLMTNISGGVAVYYGNVSGLQTTPVTLNNTGIDATIEDVNADGYADLVSTGPLGETSEPSAMLVYLGSSTGVSTASSQTIPAPPDVTDAFPAAGTPTAAGDVNGDGFKDVLANGGSRLSWGVYLYLGGPSGLDTTPAWSLEPASSTISNSAAAAADFNHDGYSDVVITQTGDGPYAELQVFPGSSAGPPSAPTVTIPGPAIGVVSGDFNGDGYADLATTSLAAIYYGGTGGLPTTPSVTITDPAVSEAIFIVGDANNDGIDDIVLYPSPSAPTTTTINVLYGATSGIATTAVSVLAVPSDIPLGDGGLILRDLNHDGYSDIVLGWAARGEGTPPIGSGYGAFYVFLGGTGGFGPSPAVTVYGSPGSELGDYFAYMFPGSFGHDVPATPPFAIEAEMTASHG